LPHSTFLLWERKKSEGEGVWERVCLKGMMEECLEGKESFLTPYVSLIEVTDSSFPLAFFPFFYTSYIYDCLM